MDPECKSLVILLIEGNSPHDGIYGIRMVQDEEYGGAFAGSGESIPISWVSIRKDGLGVFERFNDVLSELGDNVDLHPSEGRFRSRRTVLLEIENDHVRLCLWRSKGKKTPNIVREEDKKVYYLPINGQDLEEAINGIFERDI